MHDAFVVLLTKPPKYHSDKALLRWLRVVMYRLNVDRVRIDRRRR